MIVVKQDDTHNAIIDQLFKNDKPLDLTDCSVKITINNLIYEDDCTILGDGKVSYPISKISSGSGIFFYEYVVIYPDGTREIFPNDGYKKIKIVSRLESGK